MLRKQNSRMMNTFMNLLTGIVGQIIIYLLSFVTRTVFIHTLGREYLGIGGLFTNILALLSLSDLGIGTAINYRFYKPLKENDEKRIKVLIRFYKTVYTVIGCVILILGICLMPFLKYLIKDYSIFQTLHLNAALVFFLYLMQSVSTYWFFAYKSAIVKADQKEYYLNVAGYFVAFFTNVIQIVVLIVTNNYLIYIFVVIAINILQGYINARIANRLFPFLKHKSEEKLSKEEAKEIFKDCGAISLVSISNEILKSTDNIVLSAFIGLDIVGLYSNYLMFYNALKKIIKQLIRSAQASLGNLFASSSDEVKYEFFGVMNCFMVLFCGTAAVCITVLADEFITVWIGSSYVIPMPFSLLIGLELYTIGIKLILEQMRNVMGLFQQAKWRPILSMVLNVVISVSLVQQYGIYGVLIGTLSSEWLTSIIIDPKIIYSNGFHNYKPVRVFYISNLLYLVELIIIGIINRLFVNNVFLNYGWLSFFVHAIICFTSTILFILICNCNNKYMRNLLNRALSIMKKRK